MKDNIEKLLFESGKTMYAIHQATGIAQTTLSRFKRKESDIGNMSLDNAIKLNKYYEEMEKMNIPQKINENCPSCHPIEYTKTTCTYAGEKEKVTTDDGHIYEYLYECDGCEAGIWVYEDDAKRLEVKEDN